MKVCLVTGFVPNGNTYRSADAYVALGEQLAEVPLPTAAYYNTIDELWMTKYVRSLPFTPTVSEGETPGKDTLAYHCITHQKTAWLAQAVEEYPEYDIYAWVDYGVFHLPGMSAQVLVDWAGKLDDKHIYFPGWWDQGPVTTDVCNWRFCGSTFAVPNKLVGQFDQEVRAISRMHIQASRHVEWEVNTLARWEKVTTLPAHWYRGQHMANMFTNFERPA